MTDADRADFATLDAAVARGVKAAKAVLDAGRALAAIRDRQLFRLVSTTWEAYVTERHGMTRRRADQLIQAAAVLEGVREAIEATGTVVPELESVTERSVRELAGLTPSEAAAAITEAASSDAGLTPASVAKAARKRKAKGRKAKAPRPVRFRVPGATVTVVFNRKGTGNPTDALNAALAMAEASEDARREAA